MANEPRTVRSLAFVPAHDTDRIVAAAACGMDGLCLDLEDLTPLAGKDDARRIFPDVARRLVDLGAIVFARSNSIAGGMGRADLEAIVVPELHCVSIPKTNDAEDVRTFCAVLDLSLIHI